RRCLASLEGAVESDGREAVTRVARQLRAQMAEHVNPDRRGEIAAALLVDLADHRGQRALMMTCNGLEAVPELVFEADAGLASGDDDGSLGNGRIHEGPFRVAMAMNLYALLHRCAGG